ncbi:MAG: CRISPR-associated endonuclease Cas2 [Armatimonadota bacterium]|nr:CRISPR-associated endonuclease Cas2 [Armatimonadota bacterium]MDR7400225.1 CRISPR-associated endonuclease Cas2 [Armatimonadota bacterium]MDR7432861.1 CRISPR-associated endonuclease Cas2 [Armatimonadota bacterium]MDR7447328.1 CRISPR-associated endonuclease Cas2 [Armatimonadota bacterium]MDR7515631.1 CRISPR-associated endonuclease Cas2 [Armatimonadota bacterium]
MPYVVVAYDIRDDTRRLRVAKVLKNALERVQKSVFEGELDSDRLEVVEARARRHLDEREDSLRVYVLCSRCSQAVRAYGVSAVVDDPDVLIV